MSGGVVFTAGSTTTGRFGNPVAVAAGGVIPAGVWYAPSAFVVTSPSGATTSCPGGYCISDGTNVTLTAAGSVCPIGA